jgi:hypothetical protein
MITWNLSTPAHLCVRRLRLRACGAHLHVKAQPDAPAFRRSRERDQIVQGQVGIVALSDV